MKRISRNSRVVAIIAAAALLAGAAGCGAKKKAITELQRKQADHLVAEANFAINLRQWARAEGLLAQATKLVPDNGEFLAVLGTMRVRLGNKSGAKEAYQMALKAYEQEAAADKAGANADPWLQQVYVLALLGRINDSRVLLEKIGKKFPSNRNARAFIEGRQLDALLADPAFKEAAL